MPNKHFHRLLVILLCVLLTACANDNTDLQNYMIKMKHRPAKPIEPLPKFMPLPKFKFPEGEARRNPFQPIERKKLADQLAPDQDRKKQPLEFFPLDALKFVGTLKQGGVLWALIKQPSGTISRVSVGNYMGEDYGRIIQINNSSIKLEETVKEAGKWAKRNTSIKIATANKE